MTGATVRRATPSHRPARFQASTAAATTTPANSIFAFLAGQREALFPDAMFTDLFAAIGRRSVPPSVVAAVMVLQRLEGLSDREAVERFTFDARWRYAAGVGEWDSPQHRISFVHTVLVDMREQLRRSDRPDRIFEVALTAARQARLVGRKRVLDSTPLYDAVATMDTITLIRSAIRGLLAAADADLAGRLRAAIGSGDDYAGVGKPVIDWDDKTPPGGPGRLAGLGCALLAVLDGVPDLAEPVGAAMRLLATVLGQDLEDDGAGGLRIARRVAPGPGHLPRGSRSQARAQDQPPRLRRLQRPHRGVRRSGAPTPALSTPGQ